MNLAEEINKSKKYSSVCQSVVERICSEESVKYKKDKDKIKAVKNRLHTIYGAFFNENSIKAVENIISSGEDIFSVSEKLMRLNVSSNERLIFIEELYKFIFDVTLKKFTENIIDILDIGCGFNPFSLPFMLKSTTGLNIKAYHAFDIDINLSIVINKFFELSGLPKYAGCMDIISETPTKTADIAFLFKIIPTIETCKKGRGFEIINSLNTKFAVVSFPTKTLCGKNKGMAENYSVMFEENLNFDKFSIIGKNLFDNELVYVLLNKIN